MKSNHFCAAVAALATSLSASAVVVYENGTDGSFMGGNNPFTSALVTQNFTLAGAVAVHSLTYNAYTTADTLGVTDVEVRFFENHLGVVGAERFGGHFRVASQQVIGGQGGYSFTDYTVELAGVELGAGDYFLGLRVGPTQWDMHWSIVADGQPFVAASDGFGHYFRLDGEASRGGLLDTSVSAVPEPETFALLLGGLALTGFFARRRNPPRR